MAERTFNPIEVLHQLPAECQRLVTTILDGNDVMDPRTSRKVKDVLRRYEAELEVFGLIPDFYAYTLIYIWPAYQQARHNQEPPSARDMFGPHSIN